MAAPFRRPSSSLPCGVCKNIFISPKYMCGKVSNRYKSCKITRTVEEWTVSASLGCPLCWWLLYSPSCHQRFEWSMVRNFDLAPDVNSLTFQFSRTSDKLISVGPSEAPEASMKAIFFDLMANEGDPAAADCGIRPPPPVFTEQTFEEARGWISGCSARKESRCSKPESSFMPKRLLDVLPVTKSQVSNDSHITDKVYLRPCESLEETLPYATLSYCWGAPGQQLLTTSDNLAEFMQQGIAVSVLPKTVQDAVLVTRRLGIRFLWVDALCIVQDDGEDKNREMARMAAIYRNSHVTISAASAPSVADGFLGERETWSGESLAPIWLPWAASGDAADGAGIGCIGLYHNLMPALRIQDPIHERAWTLQESLLSSRLLVYSKHQLYFSCLCATLDGLVRRLGGNPTAVNRLRRPMSSDPEERKLSRDGNWASVVADYSARKLSIPSDKMPALAGVAQLFGPSEDYLAGIWRQELPASLLWKPVSKLRGCSKPDKWRAPSWSWMSLEGPVQTTDPNLVFMGKKMVEVIVASIVPWHEFSKFGPVKEAKLVLEAHITRAALDLQTRGLILPEGESAEYLAPRAQIGTAEIDCLQEMKDLELSSSSGAVTEVPVTCLCIDLADKLDAITGKSTGTVATGLVLQVTGGGEYQRVGTFCSLPSTSAHFSRIVANLEEYEIPPTYDISAHLESINGEYDERYVLHPGISCNGVKCKANSPPQSSIKGIRYYCSGCDTDYCGRCKGDLENHPDAEYYEAKENFHRYCRFRVPVKQSLFEGREWRKHVVGVEPDPVAGYARLHLV